MAYFWLNQREDYQGYGDVKGEVYNYRSNVPGHRKLSAGDRFVYYRPGEYVIFGGGRIGEIETETADADQEGGCLTEYYAHVDEYREVDPPVPVREIKDEISFLKDRDGLRGVPQNSIYEIDRADFEAIVAAAGIEDLLSGE
ncbi:MAG: hypothetical protein ABEI27_13760 [Halobellus sp.]|uniref:hypothetical protein n=1 Tax=Halobellus sp. TaxID=1979212 RepID=UPI0035D48DFD